MTKIFLTGATGYIGGDALFAIAQAHPDYEFTCLVRNSDKGAQVAKDYPSIRLVYGDLDSVALLEEESKKADIVLNLAYADHATGAAAIIKGLSAHEPPRPGFLLHCSGAGILLIDDIQAKTFGQPSEKIYNDLEGIAEVTSLPDEAPHRAVDKMILSAAAASEGGVLKTAIICSPTIYGQGRGPGNQRSDQIPELTRCTLQQGHGLKVNAGKNISSNVHVHDLSDLYLKLVENAAAGESLAEWPGKPALWGPEAVYFSENGEEHVWGEVAQLIATEAKKQGFTDTDEVKSISVEEADALSHFGHALWGGNIRSRARRAREALKWEPRGPRTQDEIRSAVEFEARKLGVKPGHAKVAAGEA